MLFIIYCVCGCCCICVRFSNFVLPNLFMIIMVLISKAMSPIRFIIIAFIPDLFTYTLSNIERRSPQTPIYQLFIIIHILHDHSSLQKQFHTSTNRMRRSRNLLLSTNKLLIHTNTSQQIRNKSYNNKPNRRHSFTNKNHNYHKKIWKNKIWKSHTYTTTTTHTIYNK